MYKQHILLVSPDEALVKPFQEELENNGYAVQINQLAPSINRQPRREQYDLVATLWFVTGADPSKQGGELKKIDALFLLGDDKKPREVRIYQNGLYALERNQVIRQFVKTVEKLLSSHPIRMENRQNDRNREVVGSAIRICGKSPAVIKLKSHIRALSQNDRSPVLISGETGTGKELVAEALVSSSSRWGKPFIKINCSAIPETLLESQLFGHIKGAFTGAVKDQAGFFQNAHNGTILLDEIGDMSTHLQPKLLRFLETQCFHRIGSARETHVNVWVIASTNADLESLIERKLFREDLYYRLNGSQITLAPLRKRKADIEILIRTFLTEMGKENIVFSPEAMLLFRAYDWPGNIRELRNVVTHCALTANNETVQANHLPSLFSQLDKPEDPVKGVLTLERMEEKYIMDILKRTDYQIRATARLLGVTRNTLKRKLEKYALFFE